MFLLAGILTAYGHAYFTYRELAISAFGILTVGVINAEKTIR